VPLELAFHPLAEVDLIQIYEFIADDSPSRAISFVTKLRELSESLYEMPYKGRLRNDLGTNVRSIALARQATIAYRIEPDCILILRIIYAGQNVDKLLED
jgi:toxin ParE1/3/4